MSLDEYLNKKVWLNFMLLSRAQMWQSLCHRNPLYRYWVGPYADAVAACFGEEVARTDSSTFRTQTHLTLAPRFTTSSRINSSSRSPYRPRCSSKCAFLTSSYRLCLAKNSSIMTDFFFHRHLLHLLFCRRGRYCSTLSQMRQIPGMSVRGGHPRDGEGGVIRVR